MAKSQKIGGMADAASKALGPEGTVAARAAKTIQKRQQTQDGHQKSSNGSSDESSVNFAKKINLKPTRPWSGRGSNPRRALVAEFVVCSVILALSPLSSKHKADSAGQWMARGAAISAFFLILGLTATASDKAGRVAAAMGAVITVALLVNDRDVFVNLLGAIGHHRGTSSALNEQSDTGTPPASASLGGPVNQPSAAASELGGPVNG